MLTLGKDLLLKKKGSAYSNKIVTNEVVVEMKGELVCCCVVTIHTAYSIEFQPGT